MRLPAYSWIGLGLLAVSEAGMVVRVEPFWTWHTPIAWTAYILLVDGIVYARRGSSWLMTNRREFFFLAAVSIPLWLIFEAYNLLIKNWYYINLPQNLIVRYVGYAWAFATISPGIFQTAELVACLRASPPVKVRLKPDTTYFRGGRAGERSTMDPPSRSALPASAVFIAIGAVMLWWPIVWPSPYLAAPVFLGFVFLLDPLNARAGDESLLADIRNRRDARLVNLLAGGFICGGLWEFWNYWARAKWIYTSRFWGTSRFSRCQCSATLGSRPSHWSVSRCTCSFAD